MIDPTEPTDSSGPSDDEILLNRLRDWLHQTRVDVENLDDRRTVSPALAAADREVGLYRLVEEFTALRHEVKLETKGSRGLQEQVETLLTAIRGAIDQFRAVVPKEEQAALAASRPLAEALADLDESLDRGQREIEKARARVAVRASEHAAALEAAFARQPWFRRFGLRAYHDQIRTLVAGSSLEVEPGLLDTLLEGYGLVRARLRRALEAGQIYRIDCVGRPVDPDRMTVVEAVTAPDFEPGDVVDEVRRGYTWRGRVLRYAEVRAARGRPLSDETESDDDSDEIIEESE